MQTIVTILLIASSAADSAVIQAAVELDSGSEDLIEMLVEKVDMIIDPKHNDTRNATHELVYALLRIGPLITIRGNITDGSNEFSLSFNFNAKAGVPILLPEDMDEDIPSEEDEIWELRNGILTPVVEAVEPYVVAALHILAQGLLSGVVTHIMYEACILPDMHVT